jgi:hypothetical protein
MRTLVLDDNNTTELWGDEGHILTMWVSGEGTDTCVVIAPFNRICRITTEDMDDFREAIRHIGEAAYRQRWLQGKP